MIEGDRREGESGARHEEIVPADRAAQFRPGARLAEERHDDRALDPRHGREDPGHDGPGVDALAVVTVAVGRDQHARGDLAEAVDDAVHAEVRRARGPDGAEARRRQHRNDRLRAVRQESGDPVTRHHAGGRETGRHAGDGSAQLVHRELAPLALFAAEDHCGGVVALAQQMGREIEFAAGEPARVHDVVGTRQRLFRRSVEVDRAEAAECFPERSRMLDRPAIQRGVVVEALLLHETMHRGRRHSIRIGPPKNRVFGHVDCLPPLAVTIDAASVST